MIQLDPPQIFDKIIYNYSFIKTYFQNSNELVNFTPIITIPDDCWTAQKGINEQINQNIDEFIYAPNYLCINVARIIIETKKF